jgi:hypothetical protein
MKQVSQSGLDVSRPGRQSAKTINRWVDHLNPPVCSARH